MTINFSRRPGSIDDADTLFGFLDPRLLAGLTPTNQVGTKSAPVETAGHDDALHADPFYYIYDDHAVPSDLTDSYVTSGGKWGPSGTFGTTGGTVTWSIAGSGWTNQTGTTFFNGSTVSMSSVLNFDYVSVLQQAFAAWSAVANINFVQVADGGGNFGVGTNGYIRIGTGYIDGLGDSNGSILAYGFYPGSAGAPQGFAYSGDIVFDSGENSSFWNANSFLAVATHEIGHALGLRHSSDFGTLMYPNYNPNILTPQTDDINGIRSIYGAATSSAGSVSISDVTITEGNSGTQFATLTRTGGSAAFSLNYATANISAAAGSDYGSSSGTLSFTSGLNTATISVAIYGDSSVESNETFALNLSSATNGATITDGQGIGTIVNDDNAATVGSISINDVTITEGNSGLPVVATFTVTRTGGTGAFSVSYVTANGTAIAGGDYAANSGTLNFAAGVNSQTISVPVFGDVAVENNETFFVNLSGATNGGVIADGQGVGTIINDDTATGSVSIGDVTITEGNSGIPVATFTVTRTGGTAAFSVSYATADGTAIAGGDYAANSGTLNFAAGVNSQTISVPVFGDLAVESNETFFVNLSNATNGAAIIDSQGLGTIINDDTVAGSVSINDVSITEGQAGTQILTFTVTRTGGASAFTVNYATANNTALSGSDYVAASGTLSFAAGVNSQTIQVTINGDTTIETNESFFVNLSGATYGAAITDNQGVATIANDDATTPGDDYADSLSDATAPIGQVNVGGVVTGDLEATNDRDWFRVTLTANVEYTFDLQGIDTNAGTLVDPYLRLYNSSGTQLTLDDDSGTGYNSHLVYTPGATGVYYIAAGSYADSYAGTYRVSLTTGVGQAAPNDFNGDGMSDILWRNDAGVIATWNMNGGTLLNGNSFGAVPSSWTVLGTDDFNGDGRSDMLWRDNASGAVTTWDINNGTVIGTHSLGVVPANWHAIGTGDFDGDHAADILWRNDAGNVALWDLNNSTLVSATNLGVVPANWEVAGTDDFNGDSRTDILWRNTTNGTTTIWDMNGGTVQGTHNLGVIPTNWEVVGTGDFNGDNHADILWQNNAGTLALWDMNNGNLLAGKTVTVLPSNWHVENAGDYNGDHMSDILLRNDAGVTAIWSMNDNNIIDGDSLGSVPNNWHILA